VERVEQRRKHSVTLRFLAIGLWNEPVEKAQAIPSTFGRRRLFHRTLDVQPPFHRGAVDSQNKVVMLCVNSMEQRRFSSSPPRST